MITPNVITGRKVLIAMLSFFGVIIAVNATFVYFALQSWPGLAVDKAFERGRDYNQTLNAARHQDTLKWRSRVAVMALSGGRVRITVQLRAADDGPINGLPVSLTLRRPVHEGADRQIALTAGGNGDYTGTIALIAAGAWDAEVRAGIGRVPRYRMIHRVMVTP
ncbi:MAG: FixH family protein [Rhodospirillaceae bacterium]|jgi:nitrogen fixation protein FixH|nr:FixH family protein [Rhodospirillaceae bacterium]MBT5297044.1 FixH family protein [Rhodospirillaceae bacterium]MBT5516226.1 FixH family protein [Rhodospirillaceae bacterium]MBT6085247.1 FixH family protein [Rhodospirillaceae bacterium]MBT6609493.1 FixH family protein [Rhodospirillaceae bacterium]